MFEDAGWRREAINYPRLTGRPRIAVRAKTTHRRKTPIGEANSQFPLDSLGRKDSVQDLNKPQVNHLVLGTQFAFDPALHFREQFAWHWIKPCFSLCFKVWNHLEEEIWGCEEGSATRYLELPPSVHVHGVLQFLLQGSASRPLLQKFSLHVKKLLPK